VKTEKGKKERKEGFGGAGGDVVLEVERQVLGD